MRDLKDKIVTRIRAGGRGGGYVSKDFLDLGTRAAVDQALSRLVKQGTMGSLLGTEKMRLLAQHYR